jgi:hypothetical protein
VEKWWYGGSGPAIAANEKNPKNRTIALLKIKMAQRIYSKPLKCLVGATRTVDLHVHRIADDDPEPQCPNP